MSVFDARLRASASHRWMNCPASAKYTDNKEHGYAAAKGTFAHDIASRLLRAVRDPAEAGRWFDANGDIVDLKTGLTPSLVRESVMRYFLFVRHEEAELGPNASTYTELPVHSQLKSIDHDLGGTADCVMYDPDTNFLRVIDYKDGFKEVYADSNPQLMTYAAGAALMLKELGCKVQRVELVIFQPNSIYGNSVDRFPITGAELRDHVNALKAAAKATRLKHPKYNAGPWCDFCPHAPACRPLAKAVGRALAATKPVLPVDPQKLGALAAQLPMVKSMVKAVEAEMYRQVVEDGVEVPGFKRVRGRNSRKFKDKKAAAEVISPHVQDKDELYDFVSPAKIEEILGRKAAMEIFNENDLIEVQQGSVTWAPVTDKRAQYSPSQKVTLEDFEQE